MSNSSNKDTEELNPSGSTTGGMRDVKDSVRDRKDERQQEQQQQEQEQQQRAEHDGPSSATASTTTIKSPESSSMSGKYNPLKRPPPETSQSQSLSSSTSPSPSVLSATKKGMTPYRRTKRPKNYESKSTVTTLALQPVVAGSQLGTVVDTVGSSTATKVSAVSDRDDIKDDDNDDDENNNDNNDDATASIVINNNNPYDMVLSECQLLLHATAEAQRLGRLKLAQSYQSLLHVRLVGLGKRFDRSEMFRRAFGHKQSHNSNNTNTISSSTGATGGSSNANVATAFARPSSTVVVPSPSSMTIHDIGSKKLSTDPTLSLSNLKSFLPPGAPQIDDRMVEELAKAAAEFHHQRRKRGGQAGGGGGESRQQSVNPAANVRPHIQPRHQVHYQQQQEQEQQQQQNQRTDPPIPLTSSSTSKNDDDPEQKSAKSTDRQDTASSTTVVEASTATNTATMTAKAATEIAIQNLRKYYSTSGDTDDQDLLQHGENCNQSTLDINPTQQQQHQEQEQRKQSSSSSTTTTTIVSTVAWTASEMAAVKSAMVELDILGPMADAGSSERTGSGDDDDDSDKNNKNKSTTSDVASAAAAASTLLRRQQELKVMQEAAREVAKALPNKTEAQVQAFMKNQRDMTKLQQVAVVVGMGSPEKRSTMVTTANGRHMCASGDESRIGTTSTSSADHISSSSADVTSASTAADFIISMASSADTENGVGMATAGGDKKGEGRGNNSPPSKTNIGRSPGRGKKPPTTPLHTNPTICHDVRVLLKKMKKKNGT